VDFEKAVRLTGEDVDYAWRGIAYSQLRRFDEALTDIKTAISLAPNNPHHRQLAGILAFALGKQVDALQALSGAIALQPQVATHYVWRAAVHIDLGEHQSAMRDLDLAVQLEASEVPLFWRGLLYLSAGQRKKALYDLKAALKESKAPLETVGPMSPPARVLFWLAVTNRLEGDDVEASKLFSRCLNSAQEETKASKHTEPARVSLLLESDVSSAKKLYKLFLQGFSSADAPKTELGHLDLLGKLFPDNSAISEIRPWLQAQLKSATASPSGSTSSSSSPSSSPRRH